MHSSFKKDLLAGKPLLGFFMMYPNPGIIERIGHEWDWFWLDCQHGHLDYKDLLSLIRVCDLVKKPVVVRVPSHDPSYIGRALDAGATGIMVPMVETVAEAAALVQTAKFFPLGNRSYGGRRVIDWYGRGYSHSANDEVVLIAQIESPEALSVVDGIAALPGIDALMPGPDDLVLRRGGQMDQPPPPSLAEDISQIADACGRHGKFMTAIAFGEQNLRVARGNNTQLLIAGGDVAFLAQSSTAATKEARRVLREAEPATTEPMTPAGAY